MTNLSVGVLCDYLADEAPMIIISIEILVLTRNDIPVMTMVVMTLLKTVLMVAKWLIIDGVVMAIIDERPMAKAMTSIDQWWPVTEQSEAEEMTSYW